MKNQAEVTQKYRAHVTNVKAMLERLGSAADKNFSTDDTNLNWGHIGDICRVEEKVKELCDLIFKEGEYAE